MQISNLELREISRFESNSRLGIPERYWGGLPVLRDIPGIRHRPWAPFLGWYVRQAGQAGAIQESVILGQTTIYPTIADLIDLLNDVPDSESPASEDAQ